MGPLAMSYVSVGSRVLPSCGYHSPRERIAEAFRRAVAHAKSPVKELARALRRSPKGAELLLRGDSSPNLETLIAACAKYDEVWETFRELCGRADSESEAEQLLAQITAQLKARRA